MLLEEFIVEQGEIEVGNRWELLRILDYLEFKKINVDSLKEATLNYPITLQIYNNKIHVEENSYSFFLKFCDFVFDIIQKDVGYLVERLNVPLISVEKVAEKNRMKRSFINSRGFISYHDETHLKFSNSSSNELKLFDRESIQELLKDEKFDGLIMVLSEVEKFHEVFKQIPYSIVFDLKEE